VQDWGKRCGHRKTSGLFGIVIALKPTPGAATNVFEIKKRRHNFPHIMVDVEML
jgi:hypothetical protein